MDTCIPRLGALLLAAVHCCGLSAAGAANASADGAVGMPSAERIERYVELCAWLTDVDYTPAQRAELRAQVYSYWRDGDRDAQAVAVSSHATWQQLHAASPDIRAATLAQTRPAVLVELQKDAANGGADSR